MHTLVQEPPQRQVYSCGKAFRIIRKGFKSNLYSLKQYLVIMNSVYISRLRKRWRHHPCTMTRH